MSLIVAVPLPTEVMISGSGMRGYDLLVSETIVVWISMDPAAQSALNLFANGK